jgi:hypothetical protein
MVPRVEYSVTAPAAPEQLWEAFCDLSRLLGRGIYTEAVFTEGQPWREGSRIRYIVDAPLKATVSAVVTLCEPPVKIGLLNHALGITAQQMVTFSRLKPDSTRVTVIMDFVGESTAPVPFDVGATLEFFCKDALDTMVARWREKQKAPGS